MFAPDYSTDVLSSCRSSIQLLFVVTFLLVVLIDVDLGLLLSIMFAFITVVVRTQSPYCALMGRVKDTDLYKDINDIEEVRQQYLRS